MPWAAEAQGLHSHRRHCGIFLHPWLQPSSFSKWVEHQSKSEGGAMRVKGRVSVLA